MTAFWEQNEIVCWTIRYTGIKCVMPTFYVVRTLTLKKLPCILLQLAIQRWEAYNLLPCQVLRSCLNSWRKLREQTQNQAHAHMALRICSHKCLAIIIFPCVKIVFYVIVTDILGNAYVSLFFTCGQNPQLSQQALSAYAQSVSIEERTCLLKVGNQR